MVEFAKIAKLPARMRENTLKAWVREAIDAARSGKRSKRLSSKSVAKLESDICRVAAQLCAKYENCEEVVYFVKSGDFVKIGVTTRTTEARITDFTSGSPHDYELLAELCGNRKLEAALHNIFCEYRYKGEWFRYSGDLERFIQIIRHNRLPSSNTKPPVTYRNKLHLSIEQRRRELDSINILGQVA